VGKFDETYIRRAIDRVKKIMEKQGAD